MPLQTSTTREIGDAWNAVLDAAGHAESLVRANQHAALAPGADGRLHVVEPGHPDAVIAWRPHAGFEVVLPPDDPRHAMIDLYLPICSATGANPLTVGHLGQSLDGFIATHSGESQYVTGEENILHLHRMRALCDAVVVGAGTVAADDPQLTTRHVSGPSPLRVVLDPTRRLAEHYKVFTDDSAVTLYMCATSLVREGETHVGRADDRRAGRRTGRCRRRRRAARAARARLPPHLRRRRRRHGVDVPRSQSARPPAHRDRAAAHRRRPSGDPPARRARRSATAIARATACSAWARDVLFDCEIGPDGNNARRSPIRSRRSPGSSELL